MLFNKKQEKQPENLKEVLKKIKELEKHINKLSKDLEISQEQSLNSFSKVRVSRFNLFSDMGGDQSFTIVFLNRRNNGFILTSLYGREEARVFTKPIINGKSEYQLLEEESKNLNELLKNG